MITTKEVKIKIPQKLTSEYIETELAKMGFDVLRWAIVSAKDGYYYLTVATTE